LSLALRLLRRQGKENVRFIDEADRSEYKVVEIIEFLMNAVASTG